MHPRFLLIAVAVLALLGCGAGHGPGEEAQASGSAQVKETPAPAAPAATAAPAPAKASKTTKPAIDTSGLKMAPTWALTDMSGKVVKSSDLLGKVVLVDFWATWCGPCKAAIPHLIDLYDRYKAQGVEIVGVSLDQQGPSVVKPFIEKNRITYPIVMGNGKVAQDFGGVRGIPTAFVITQDGKIYKSYVGLRPKETYEVDIKALLGITS
jgi:thiol-disulfide isomerase/thioredoxin